MAVNPNLKLIKLNSRGVNNPDDPSFPFKLEVTFSPPEFMNVAFLFLVGAVEEVIVRAVTLEDMNDFLQKNEFRTHPRLIKGEITGPSYKEEFTLKSREPISA